MIEELRIRDLGVIADTTLPLGPGLTAITGETGAGKTMVVTALGLLLGERADPASVRGGCPQASVEGVWRLDAADSGVAERVEEAGGAVEDGELVLARTLAREGRSRAHAGGRTVPVGVLAELGARLVVVHGQSEQLRLRSAAAQRDALDRYAASMDPDYAAVRDALADAVRRWRALEAELRELEAAREARRAEADELRAAIDWVERVAPRAGEDAELEALADRLQHAETLRQDAAAAHDLLAADDGRGADTLLGEARRRVERAAEHDPTLQPVAEALAGLVYGAADAATQLAAYLDGLQDADPIRLDTIQERRAELAELVRRHGPTLDDAIGLLGGGSARLLELERTDERIGDLLAEVAAAGGEAATLADRLTALRVAAAERLAHAVTGELAALAMPTARLVVEVTPAERVSESGQDEVAMLLAPHPGAAPRPVGRGASGGELSRIMLAIEVVLAAADPVPTFVFDEVDAGVGGAAAIEIGRRLARLADVAQVIVVTHLAQVAAFADTHLRIEKDTAGDVTASSVARLDGAEREREMARLLSGLADSASGLEHARELLALRGAGG